MPAPLEPLDDAQLVQRRGTGDDSDPVEMGIEFFRWKAGQILRPQYDIMTRG
jgi:hypothetical protein